jgi:hypothetical protein
MSTTHQDQDKSSGKPRQRGRKADQRRPPSEQQQTPKLDRRGEDQFSPMTASTEAPSHDTGAPAAVPLTGEVLPPDIRSTGVPVPMDIFPVGIQAIAMAYADYTARSFDGSRSFAEKLMGVRSTRRSRFRPNSQGRLMLTLSRSRTRCANFTAGSSGRSSCPGNASRPG